MRLKATSIVESITAMVIILISFGVGMMIYMNILRSENLVSKTKANLILNQVLEKTLKEKNFVNGSLQKENLLIVKSVLDYPDYQDVFCIKLEAFNSKKESILELKEVVFEEKE